MGVQMYEALFFDFSFLAGERRNKKRDNKNLSEKKKKLLFL